MIAFEKQKRQMAEKSSPALKVRCPVCGAEPDADCSKVPLVPGMDNRLHPFIGVHVRRVQVAEEEGRER